MKSKSTSTRLLFPGATEFVEKFKDKTDAKDIIGKFGLGFYSAFMVADKVEVISKSFKENTEGCPLGMRWLY
jgi:molecular chaperone HtpG